MYSNLSDDLLFVYTEAISSICLPVTANKFTFDKLIVKSIPTSYTHIIKY